MHCSVPCTRVGPSAVVCSSDEPSTRVRGPRPSHGQWPRGVPCSSKLDRWIWGVWEHAAAISEGDHSHCSVPCTRVGPSAVVCSTGEQSARVRVSRTSHGHGTSRGPMGAPSPFLGSGACGGVPQRSPREITRTAACPARGWGPPPSSAHRMSRRRARGGPAPLTAIWPRGVPCSSTLDRWIGGVWERAAAISEGDHAHCSVPCTRVGPSAVVCSSDEPSTRVRGAPPLSRPVASRGPMAAPHPVIGSVACGSVPRRSPREITRRAACPARGWGPLPSSAHRMSRRRA